MGRLLLLFAILQIVHCSCPPGFDLVRDGECRGHYEYISIRDDQATSEAVARCEEVKGHPVIIHNDEHQVYWTRSMPSTVYRIVLGLVCPIGSTRWEWSDGSPVDYRPPGDFDTALNHDCKHGCVWYISNNGVWGEYCDTAANYFNVSCTTQLTQPVLSDDGCDGFGDDAEDGACYQVGDTAETFQDAQMTCAMLGANLASIHNSRENSFVRRQAVSNGAVNGIYLGANKSGKGNDFGWIDGSEWDYDNFHQGFPMTGLGECLAMDTSNSAGLWMNINCSSELPVACARQQRNVTKPTCGAGPWKEGDFITSPGFPFSASTYCDYFLTVEEGKNVEVEIIFLEANSCCDFLTLYDGYLGGKVIANLTGEKRNVTYTTTTSNIMRVNWQPDGGVNVMGMAMTFRGV